MFSLLRIVRELARRWRRDDTGLLAASVAFYGAVSLFPILLVLTSGLGAFLKWTKTGNDARQWIVDAISEQVSPTLAESIRQSLEHVQEYAGFSGPIGAVTLLFAALAIFAQFEHAFDRIWTVQRPGDRSAWAFVRQALTYRLRAFLLLVGLGFVVVLVFAAGWALSTFQSGVAARFSTANWIWWILETCMEVGLNAFVFAALYRWLPKQRVSWRLAWRGGWFAAITWELGRQLLTVFVIGQHYTSAYGIIGTLMAIMIWGYYGIAVVLVGAQLVCLLAERGPAAGAEPVLASTPQSNVHLPGVLRVRAPGRILGFGFDVAFALLLLYVASFLAMRQWRTRDLTVAAESPQRVVVFSSNPKAHQIARVVYTPLIHTLPGAYQYPTADELIVLGIAPQSSDVGIPIDG